MNLFFRRLLTFLSGIPFAVALIALTALFAIAGTFLESWTDSHAYAATFSYHSPVFLCLLGGFFVNILLSALRRWPFRRRHAGFLLTHLGLLMLLSGVFIKQLFGLQGHMLLTEGSGSQQVLLDGTQVIKLISREESTPSLQWRVVPQQFGPLTCLKQPLPQTPTLSLLTYWEHVNESPELWVKDEQVHISGLPHLPLQNWDGSEPLRICATAQIQEEPWQFICAQTDNIQRLLYTVYLQETKVLALSALTGEEIEQISLQQLLENDWQLQGENLKGQLILETGPDLFSKPPRLDIQVQWPQETDTLTIPLDGPDALLNSTQGRGFPFELALVRPATIALIQDEEHHEWLFAIDAHGYIKGQRFPHGELESYIAYDQGFGGFTVEANILPPAVPRDFLARRRRLVTDVERRLHQITTDSETLIPPFEALREACKESHLDFAHTLVDLLHRWHATHELFWPEHEPLPDTLKQVMNQLSWSGESPDSPEQKAAQLTAGIRLFGIDWSVLHPKIEEGEVWQQLAAQVEQSHSPHRLETPLTRHYQKLPPLRKQEDNIPFALFAVTDGKTTQQLPLRFDKTATDLAWPVLGGRYLARFQPETRTLPHRLRLHYAHQKNHPGSTQPQAYEAEVTVTDVRNESTTLATLKMNQVLETHDGYRFYLANISPSEPGTVKRVQLVVNHDPAKYWLTYPGGIFVALGIALLFITQPYQRKKSSPDRLM